ncbi:putative exodeoxyribonuclease I [Helianthus annuus]|uniref:exonuclease 1 isoform X1 n=1 Tax=Helianthus annuus TaxID=4232 RepID=UPI000B8F20B3|nr:exonuclease 1 isoform X1 [Helianthus annuus]KAJ0581548.1 putative exodeoxyribonuclease I [Helianthus annuus]KAJ0589537.1 putative exodeoxyribonuclease I [Helianthus annuus]KAJ0597511.1 putative exodeoxyribonuclease I [Helianthus annuus]KAJ0758160.1 putative exodeoxyribonuclease I [Helianthus annuus]KAJ0761818.1 putative exodeoxyribonuclease I [Helianthus annuus]
MGIQGLLPLLKSIMVPIHIKDLEGCSVAVDTYSWLHKGALSCSKELCKSEPTSKHVNYCMHRVNLLRHYGVKPILVFDGGHLPMKNDQEIKRARSRKENLARAIEHESCGNASAAYECYQKAVDISPEIAYELIQVLKTENISYVVAPYEADAQMTFLAISKHVDAVITEDSDLIPFGCPRIIYKMDKYGQGVEFRYSKLQNNKELNFTGFTKQMILEMCIFSGCDYLQSLPGMGLKKAHALIKKLKSYDKVIKHLKFSGIIVPPSYEESFRKAIMTFQHQRVYDPVLEEIVFLSNFSDNIDEDLDFLGPSISQNLAKGIASGDINPLTKLPIQGDCVKEGPVLDGTYNLKSFKPEGSNKKLDLPAQKNLLTNYFCFASLEAKRKFKAPRVSPKHTSPTSEILQFDSSEEIVDTVVPRKTAKLMESVSYDDMRGVQHSTHTIHPCIASQKELEPNSFLGESEGKTRVQKKPVVVRSRYFQYKSSEEINEVNVASKNTTSSCDPVSVSGSVEVKARVENTKPNKSRYFTHKNQENTNESRLETNINEGLTMKRKFSIVDDSVQNDDLSQKYTRADQSHANQGVCNYDPMQATRDEEEEKFGCNISHLGKYSEIAEKSMEKFMSVISSFKCTSTGSRASGLRAPLKDVRNTFTKRSSPIDDISKFAYTPAKPLPSRRP